MSDTSVIVETENLEEAPVQSEETSVSTQEATSPRTEKRGGDRKPRSRDRNGLREEPKEFQEEMLSIDRVTRVTAGGRQLRFRASIVIGDGKGRVGLGIGKSGEVQGAIEKAIRDAKKNLITFPMVNGTIPHDIAVNFKSSSLFLHPAHAGTGIIAGGSVRKIFAVSGIKDIIAKQHGAPNGITNARVTMKALSLLKPLSLTKRFDSQKSESASTEAPETTSVKKAPAKKPTTKKKAD